MKPIRGLNQIRMKWIERVTIYWRIIKVQGKAVVKMKDNGAAHLYKEEIETVSGRSDPNHEGTE